ncbi:MAG: hypothetical protein OQK51_25790 [Kangiellaceae bacterium]|nr:hypothetical protein [Kangiellaceae bacterium]
MNSKAVIPKEHLPPKLVKERVPACFWPLIPLAEKYGIADDVYRYRLVKSLGQIEKEQLSQFLYDYDNKLDEWLAGPESMAPDVSNEYVAFSALRIAAEEAA